MHKPNLFIVVTVKFNIAAWLFLMQPGWAVVRRTNCRGCPLGYVGRPVVVRVGPVQPAPRAGGFSQVRWIVYPVKLPSCLEGAGRIYGWSQIGTAQRWEARLPHETGHSTETLQHTEGGIPWMGVETRSPTPHPTLVLIFPIKFQFCGFSRFLAIGWPDIVFSVALMEPILI